MIVEDDSRIPGSRMFYKLYIIYLLLISQATESFVIKANRDYHVALLGICL